MSPEDVKSMFYRKLERDGEFITFNKISPFQTWTALATVRGYRADELVGGIQVGWSEVIAYADHFPISPVAGHEIVASGRTRRIERVDRDTIRVQAVTCAYKMSVSG